MGSAAPQIDVQPRTRSAGPAGPRPQSSFVPEPAHPLLTLQQQAGNQAVQSLLRQAGIHPKLAISQPDDPEEREADQVADRVMRASVSSPMEDSASGAFPDGSAVHRKCSSCEEDENKLVRQSSVQASHTPVVPIPPIVHEVLGSSGQPLDSVTRDFFEPRFRQDFSKVRIHNNDVAARSAREVNAHAYTVGQQIVFGSGSYQPGTDGGRHLLAHELTHIVQQGNESGFLHRAAIYHGNILDEGTCEHLACRSKWACPDESGLECPEGTRNAYKTKKKKFVPLMSCDKKCENAQPCSDSANWMAIPEGRFAFKKCAEDLVICANNKSTHATVRDKSEIEAWEVSHGVQDALGVSPYASFTGSIYGSDSDPEFQTDSRCRPAAPKGGGSKQDAGVPNTPQNSPLVPDGGMPDSGEPDAGTIMRMHSGASISSPCSCSESEEQCEECKQKQSPVVARTASNVIHRQSAAPQPAPQTGPASKPALTWDPSVISAGIQQTVPPYCYGESGGNAGLGTSQKTTPGLFSSLCAHPCAYAPLPLRVQFHTDGSQVPRPGIKPGDKVSTVSATVKFEPAGGGTEIILLQNQSGGTYVAPGYPLQTTFNPVLSNFNLPGAGQLLVSLINSDSAGQALATYSDTIQVDVCPGTPKPGIPVPSTSVQLGKWLLVPDPVNAPLQYTVVDKNTPINGPGVIVQVEKDDKGYFYRYNGQRVALPGNPPYPGAQVQSTPPDSGQSATPQPPVQRTADGNHSHHRHHAGDIGSAASMLPRDGGQPLDAQTRAFFEPRFGHDFGEVRLHNSAEAAQSAHSIEALAYTAGNHIFFGTGQYQPSSEHGKRLLAHELTHTIQQNSNIDHSSGAHSTHRTALGIQRDAGGPGASVPQSGADLDSRYQAELANARSTGNWQSAAELLNGFNHDDIQQRLAALTPQEVGYIHQGALDNPSVGPDSQLAQLTAPGVPPASTVAPESQTVGEVPRPAGLPPDDGFMLVQAPQDLQALASLIPEAQLISLDVHPAGSRQPTQVTSPAAGAAAATSVSTNAALQSQGFAAAGENAIFIVAIPRAGTPGAMIPESTSIWGHTAVGVRIDGKIQVVRGLSPASTVETVKNYSGVRQGTADVAAAFTDDTALLTKAGALTVEYPVTREVADAFARQLPAPGPVGPGGPTYTAVPGNACQGENCVLWAVNEAEQALKGRIGPAGGPPITDLPNPGQGGQGPLIRFIRNASEGGEDIAPVEGAIGPAIASGMPTGLKVLKVGGRVMLVVSLAMIPVETYLAPPEERERTFVGASGGFLGGFAAGAAAGMVCGPGAPACSIVLGLGAGFLGSKAGRAAAEGAYDLAVNVGKMTPAQWIDSTTLMFGTPEQKRANCQMKEIEGVDDPLCSMP